MTDLSPILAIIPAFNEEAHIGLVVEGVRAHLPVLVVDDGSKDSTVEIAKLSGAEVIRQVPNQGKGAALRAGFQYALQGNYLAVLTLDADGQHNPAEIPIFINRWKEAPADLLIGARDFSLMPPSRRLANTLGQWSFSWAMGQHIQDNQSGYRLISRRLVAALLVSQEHGFEFEVEMIVTCLENGFSLDWVPIHTIYAGEKSHIRPLQHASRFIRVLFQTRRRRRRPHL